jgi:hypothetical protein
MHQDGFLVLSDGKVSVVKRSQMRKIEDMSGKRRIQYITKGGDWNRIHADHWNVNKVESYCITCQEII